MLPHWFFPPHQDGYLAQDPIQRSFFTVESIGGLEQALVREAIQNALDARSGNEPVLIRFALLNSVDPNDYAPFFGDLIPHLEAAADGVVEVPDFSSPMKFVIVEDFNTTGLEGDPEKNYIQVPAPDQDFYYFWRNIGRTGKTESNRGRWGLGKTVFPAASTFQTFFGLTCRQSDGQRMLMGQSVLKHHTIGNTHYTPYGYFALTRANSQFALPITDSDPVDHFRETFKLMRKNKPGLSIVIPAPAQDMTIDSIKIACIQQYYYAIMVGDLYLLINDVNVKRDNLEEFTRALPDSIEGFDKAAFLRTLSFVSWAINLEAEDYIQLGQPHEKSAPNWNDYLPENQLQTARERFEADGKVAFRVGMKVERKREKRQKQQIHTGWFKVFIERDDQLKKPESHYLRNGIRLVDIKGHSLRGIRALVVIDDEKLSKMLGDAENPAHTEWQKDAPAFKQFEHGPSSLSFVKNSLAVLAGKLTKAADAVEQDLLKDIFYLENPNDGLTAKTSGIQGEKPDQGITDTGIVNLPKRDQPITSRKTANGIEISSSEISEHRVGTLHLRFAYEVVRGNPFQKYSPLDFSFDDLGMRIESENVEVAGQSANLLTVHVLGVPFRVRVTGFDGLRDVVMKVDWDEEGEDLQ
ncbi:hypothetical protein ANRL4_03955 [Anaerolineae bacterium]|nr:hypothetical protein ANRL4_03955 [Anaerolineae bacterium]